MIIFSESAPCPDRGARAGGVLEQPHVVPRLAGQRRHAQLLRPPGRGGQGLRLLRPRQGGGRQGIQEQQKRHLRKSFMEVKKVPRPARYQSNSAISNIVVKAPALNILYYHAERN